MSFQKKWKFYFLISLLAAILAVGHWQQNGTFNQNLLNNPDDNFLEAQFNPETATTTNEEIADANLPESFLIPNVPFQTQAPFANWDQLHDEACEEASVILVNYYLKNKTLSNDIMDDQILQMVDWQMKNWGSHKDLTAQETLELAQNFYGLQGRIIRNANITTLKKEIVAGHPVIVPTAGRLLGNPNFRGEGPVYHMVVAIGFDAQNIIVQDVGTRKGEHYVYNQKIFYNAMHEWAGSPDNITNGEKVLLILTSQTI